MHWKAYGDGHMDEQDKDNLTRGLGKETGAVNAHPMRWPLLCLLLTACCRGAHPTPPTPAAVDAGKDSMIHPPLEVDRVAGEVPREVAAATGGQRGLGDAVFAAASADGGLVALQLNVASPTSVVVVRNDGGRIDVTTARGNLLAGAPPMVGDAAEGATDVTIRELATGAVYRAPLRVTSADAGGPPPDFEGACCGWWDGTRWRASLAFPAAGLLRVADGGDWALADWYRPDDPRPVWRHPLVGRVVDAVVTPRVELAVVYTLGRNGGTLTAYLTDGGRQIWQVSLPDGTRDGALVVIDDEQVGVVVADRTRCETCAALEVRDLVGGDLLQRIALGSGAFPSVADRGETVQVGVAANEVWIRTAARRSVGSACRLDVYDLATGARREVAAPWAALFADCAGLAQVAPTTEGMAVIHPTALWAFDFVRFNRAPCGIRRAAWVSR